MDSVTDEYIKKFVKVRYAQKQPPVSFKTAPPKGRKTPPGLRVASYPTFSQLENWRQMHQHSAFNKSKIITGSLIYTSIIFSGYIKRPIP